MARTIQKSVGINGFNRPADVITIQEALNHIQPSDGGPTPLLEMDGKCGPKTKKAIQKFQLHHFGWKGADGRVDPDGQTIVKLNEVARPPTTAMFVVQQQKQKGTILRSNPNDWFFFIEQVVSINPFPGALFWFGPAGKAPADRPERTKFAGSTLEFLRTPRPATLQELIGPGVMRMIESSVGKFVATSFDAESPHALNYSFPLTVGMDPAEPLKPGVLRFVLATNTFTEFRGELQLVG